MTCPTCASWTAKTWADHDHRMRNIRDVPNASVHPCPSCGGTDWATKPPDYPREHMRDRLLVFFVSGALIAGLIIALIILLMRTV